MSYTEHKPLQFLPSLEISPSLSLDIDKEFERAGEDAEMRSPRSPRTPTYKGGEDPSIQPYDPYAMFSFPSLKLGFYEILSPSPCTTSEAESSPGSESTTASIDLSSLLPPPQPLKWIWKCHLCRSRYPLGATRRCLVDGHYYCSGETAGNSQRNVKRKKRGQSCSSEFDYDGWREWNAWRQNFLSARRAYLMELADQNQNQNNKGRDPASPQCSLQGCEKCDYPSQCRHENMRPCTSKSSTHPNTSPSDIKSDTAKTSTKSNSQTNDVSEPATPSQDSLTRPSKASKRDNLAENQKSIVDETPDLASSARSKTRQVTTNTSRTEDTSTSVRNTEPKVAFASNSTPASSSSAVQPPADQVEISKDNHPGSEMERQPSHHATRQKEKEKEKEKEKKRQTAATTTTTTDQVQELTKRDRTNRNLASIKGRFYSSRQVAGTSNRSNKQEVKGSGLSIQIPSLPASLSRLSPSGSRRSSPPGFDISRSGYEDGMASDGQFDTATLVDRQLSAHARRKSRKNLNQR